jgi:hypothetical protein
LSNADLAMDGSNPLIGALASLGEIFPASVVSQKMFSSVHGTVRDF